MKMKHSLIYIHYTPYPSVDTRGGVENSRLEVQPPSGMQCNTLGEYTSVSNIEHVCYLAAQGEGNMAYPPDLKILAIHEIVDTLL